jgi:hypothetical protein
MRNRRAVEGLVGMSVVALALSAGMATASAQEDKEKSEQTVIKSRTFTIPRGQCPHLPADLTVEGLGLERTKTIVRERGGDERPGALHASLSSTITGTATDNAGGTYTFTYNLRVDSPIPGSGIAVDVFTLTGRGRANGLSTAFRAKVTFDSGFNPIAFELLQASGDPFQCDPL